MMRHALWEAKVSPHGCHHTLTDTHTSTIMLRYFCVSESKTKQVNDRLVQKVKDLDVFHVAHSRLETYNNNNKHVHIYSIQE